MENEKGSIGVLICIIIIILLIFTSLFIYFYYNYFEVKPANTKIENLQEEIQKHKKIISGTQENSNNNENGVEKQNNDFNDIYNAIFNTGMNEGFKFIISGNKIKNIVIDEIRIYNSIYSELNNINIGKNNNENLLYGACTFTIEFEDLTNLKIAENSGITKDNYLVTSKYFIYNKTSNVIEIKDNL